MSGKMDTGGHLKGTAFLFISCFCFIIILIIVNSNLHHLINSELMLVF